MSTEKTYKNIFNDFKTRFLEGKKSIFNLDDESEILTKDSLDYLDNNFIKNAHIGDANFIEKVKHQLIDDQKESDDLVKKNAVEILATAVWLWRLPPSNSTEKGRKNSVKEILDLNDSLKKYDLKDNKYFAENIKGFASPGTLYNTSKPSQLVYIIMFLKELLDSEKSNDDSKYIKILNSARLKSAKAKVTITTDYSKEKDNNGKVKKNGGLISKDLSKTPPEPSEGSVSMRNALLHLFAPGEYEPILSMSHKSKIVDGFSDKLELGNEDKTEDEKLTLIRKNMDISTGDFYEPKYREVWDPQVLPAKNVIYYGAPGTGKTYQVTELVKLKTQDNNDRFVIQQFHPSFSYEDFIDGVKPDCIGNGGMQFKLVNGVFKELCIKAFQELVRAKTAKEEPKDFYFIADEINRAELSRVFGELLLCLEEDKRLRFDDEKLLGIKIKTQNSQLWQKTDAVVVCESDDYYFGVPENLYFLGTMNDIDRSIDSFDLALRRRFMWVHKGCDYDVIADTLMEKGANDDVFLEYLGDGKNESEKGRCLLLNEYISKTLNLGESYELGHSYFMKIDIHNSKISKSAYERLFDYEMAPLLTEYLRAEYSGGKELKDKLVIMRNLFTKGKNA